MSKLAFIEEAQVKEETEISVGDTVKVHFRIIEGKTERIQVYEGLVIVIKHSGIRKSFTVRKISFGVGVERVFPLHSPRIQSIEVVKHGRVRRAKLYYIRDRVGKAARVRERIVRRKDKK